MLKRKIPYLYQCIYLGRCWLLKGEQIGFATGIKVSNPL